jgi:1-pyrroline-5-carboxylate dehydrogenase
MDSVARTPELRNEPVLSYAPGTTERALLKKTLEEMAADEIEMPLVIGGREVRTGRTSDCTLPHRHRHRLGIYHKAQAGEVTQAIEAARAAHGPWSALPWEDRAAVLLRAADLLAGKYRPILNAATMLGQSKTAHQAEIDSACELIDFFRFNAAFARQIYAEQPMSAPGAWNRLDYRPLEGFVFAVTPFNFTSIGGNLPTAPVLMGNTVVWKPASSAVFSAHYIMQLLLEAGLPDGVINLVYGSGAEVGDPLLASAELGGIHFTGSTEVFNGMWRKVSEGLGHYKGYPRLVGETGGKDFIIAHPSAGQSEDERAALVTAIVRGGFEYQGQKCSAASRIYLPESVWRAIEGSLVATVKGLAVGDPSDFRNFMGAVIDQGAYKRITGYQKLAAGDSHAQVIAGGGAKDTEGWFVEPTLVVVDDPRHQLLREEIFGPVVTIFIYPDAEWEKALRLVDEGSPYALTGAVFARDRAAIRQASQALRHAAGNFYINDKPTGAVVGQQPFGGARASGTNDKAGSLFNLLRWVQPRTIKETFAPPTAYPYPFMNEK